MDSQYLAALQETLQQTLVADTSVIKKASQKLVKELYPSPLALPSMFQIVQKGDDQLKQLAAVETRKLVNSKWAHTDASVQTQIRSGMLEAVFGSQSKLLRHSCARVVATIAEIDLPENAWPELLPFLIEKINGDDVATKEIAVYTLYTLLETQTSVLLNNTSDFVDLFAQLLTYDKSRDVRVNAVLAFDTLSQFIETDAEIDDALANKFKDSIPLMVEVMKEVVAANDIEKAKDVFNVFNSFVFVDSKLVGNHLISLIQLISELAVNKALDEELRVFALQFLISCASIRKSKIVSSKLGPSLTLIALKVASEEIDVEEELENEDEENENEENEPPTLGLRLIAMLAAELPPSQVITPIFENLNQMVSSSNQFERRAGILAIGVSSPGAPDFMGAQINRIVPALVSGLKDSEVVVKVAALRSLGQLTTEIQDVITEYHEQFLPLLIEIIDSATSVAVYKYACLALDGLIEYLSYESVTAYLEPLMNKLIHMLQQANSSTLKAAIVSAIGSTAYAAGKKFTPFFNDSIKFLEPFIANAAVTEGMSEDDIELRALTFENISTMARAVGSATFSSFATPLIEAAYGALSSEQSRIRESGFAFISNMAKVYGVEFAGFLEKIVPVILKCLEQEEFTFNFDDEDADLEDEENLADKLNVNTGITYEKEIAAVALGELAVGTGKEFYQYVEASVKVLADQAENSYGMRESALIVLWKIVRAMFKAEHGADYKPPIGVPKQSYVNDSILALMKQVRDLSVDLLEEEFEMTMVACILDNLVDGLSVIGPMAIVESAADTTQLQRLCAQLMNILKKEHISQAEDEEIPQDEEEASEAETVLFDNTLEVLVSLSMNLGGDFEEIFKSFKDIIISNVSSKSKTKRVSAVGCLGEICNGLKAHNAHSQQLLELFINRLSNDVSLEVKSNAAYGIGIVIEYSPTDFSSSYQHILELLFHLLNKTDSQASDADDEASKDVVSRSYANACGCVARLAIKNQAAVPIQHIIQPLLSHLPLETAFEENTPILTLIMKLYESSNEAILGQTDKVVDVLGKIFAKEFERVRLLEVTTLGREEYLARSKQFESEEFRQKLIGFLKVLEQKYFGVVSGNEVLKQVI